MKLLVFRVKSSVLGLMVDALIRQGVEVSYCDPLEFSSIETLMSYIENIGPTFCLAQNDYSFDPSHPLLAQLEEYLRSRNIPVVCWYVDHPALTGSFASVIKMSAPCAAKNFYYFYPDPDFASFFKDRNHPASLLLSAADGGLAEFRAPPPQYDLSLVANPGIAVDSSLPTLEHVRWASANLFFDTVNLVFGRSGIYQSRLKMGQSLENIRGELLKRIEDAIYNFLSPTSMDPQAYQEKRTKLLLQVADYSIENSNRIQMLLAGPADIYYSTFELMSYVYPLKAKGLRLFGPDTWKIFFPELDYTPQYLAPPKLYEVYGESRINFCYTKRQFSRAVVERPLHVLAADGFPLTDDRAGWADFFEKGEIALYQSVEEAKSLVDFYLKNESLRHKMTKNARAKVFKYHTYAHRARQMIDTVTRHFDL